LTRTDVATSRRRAVLGHPVLRVVGASFVAQIALAVSGPLVVRLVGVEARGELALLFALVLLFGQIGMIGIPTAVAYFIARDRIPAKLLLLRYGYGYLAQCGLVAGVAMVGVGAWAATGNRLYSPGNEVLLVGAGVALLMLIFMVQACLQGEHRFRQLARVQSAPSLIYAGCVLVLYVGGSAVRSSCSTGSTSAPA
jgi:O-antigen/teichoic acid export membrane protein